jgi:hypothetical protein
MQRAAVLHLALANDADGFKAILEAVHAVPKTTTETVKIFGHPVELFMPFEGTTLEFVRLL